MLCFEMHAYQRSTHLHLALHFGDDLPQELELDLLMIGLGPGRWARWGHSVTASCEGFSNDRCTDRRVYWVGTIGAE